MPEERVTDEQLLDRYIHGASQEAFARLVSLHAGMVYSAARRQLMNHDDARDAADVTQTVFFLLAKKPKAVRGSVAGWLMRTTWFVCRNAVKLAARRRFHERRAASMRTEMTHDPQPAWESYSPVVDTALASLAARDRDAIVLRYLCGLSLAEVGESLGVNEHAARKRIDRGMQRLRSAIAKKTAAPQAATIAEHLASQAVRPAPAALVRAIAAGAAMHAIGGLSQTLAAQGLRAIFWAQMKLAAIVTVGIFAVGGGTLVAVQAAESQKPKWPAPLPIVLAQANSTNRSPETKPDISTATQPANHVQLVAWDALVNPNVLEAIKKIATPVQTKTHPYVWMACNGFELRSTIQDASASGDVITTGNCTFGTPDADGNIICYHNCSGGSSGPISVFDGGFAPDALRVGADSLKFFVQGNMQMTYSRNEQPFSFTSQAVTLDYDGQLKLGDALIMVNSIKLGKTPYVHVIAWETFEAPDQEMPILALENDREAWIEGGVEAELKLANSALVWGAGASHLANNVPAAWEKKLDDGKTVRLVGLMDLKKFPLCPWDADGNPLKMSQFNITSPMGIEAIVQVIGARSEYRVANWPEGYWANDRYEERNCIMVDGRESFDVGVLTGSWIEEGSITPNQPTTIHGTDYELDIRPDKGGAFSVQFKKPMVVADRMLTMVGTDGTTESTNLSNEMEFQINKAANTDSFYFAGHTVPASKLDHIVISYRNRQWVTFANFAAAPKSSPKSECTDADVSAVQTALDKQKADETHASFLSKVEGFEARRDDWKQIPPDARTAQGAARIFVDAIKAGDENAARALATGPTVAWSNLLIHSWAIDAQIYANLTARIGEAGIYEFLNTSRIQYSADIAEVYLRSGWQTNKEGSLLLDGTYPILLQPDGTYKIQTSREAIDSQLLTVQQKENQAEQKMLDTLKSSGPLTMEQLQNLVHETWNLSE